MSTTGYWDNFFRTTTNGLGTADSGQGYSYQNGTAQWSTDGQSSNCQLTTAGDHIAVVSRRTRDVDITGQVALSAVPATNQATIGFVTKWGSSGQYYYSGTMMVAAGGAMSLRFSKNVAGTLSTVITTPVTTLTFATYTLYNLRVAVFWSHRLQTNVLRAKIWAVGAMEPGGWLIDTRDASITPFTSGGSAGIMARDDSTTLTGIYGYHQFVSTRGYKLPMPATTDKMCLAPGAVDSADLCSLAYGDGTFESHDPSVDWDGYSCAVSRQQSVVYDGLWSGQMTAQGTNSQMVMRPHNGLWTPTVVPGQDYLVNLQMRSAKAYPDVSAAVDWLDSSFNYLSTSSAHYSLTANTWTPLTLTATAPANAMYASYGPTVGSPTDGDIVYVDNVDFLTNCSAASTLYPAQTALQALAVAADAVFPTFDVATSVAAAFPRVRVSVSNTTFTPTFSSWQMSWAATEFNVGTDTNLGLNSQYVYLPQGIWLIECEVQLAEAASNSLQISLNGWWNVGSPSVYMRSNAAQLNDQGVGGTGHVSALTYNSDPASNIRISVQMFPTASTTAYTVKYAALSAIKISDYFV